MSPKAQERRKIICAQFIENPTMSGQQIAKKLKIYPRAVQRILKRFKGTLSIEKKPGSGRKVGSGNKELRRKVKRSLGQNPVLSDRDKAKRFQTSKTTIRKIRAELRFKAFRVVKCPNRNDKQNVEAKKRARKLYDNVLTKTSRCILMDDETYVKLDFQQIAGYNYYYSTFRGGVANRFKFKIFSKYGKKMMIWQAICSCGRRSTSYVVPRTMNTNVYITECLEKRILPMAKLRNHPVVFWPDLASMHYARDTLAWLDQKGIQYVAKDMNPPNCPELRPIERYWAIIKSKLLATKGSVKNDKELQKSWDKCVATVGKATVQKLMGGIKRRVRKFIRNEN